ncbi:MAG: NTP transferase domain-containing protein [Akkermansia sp.]|nr:NTP transferase domain-containing protein [Akkermansia sp.]
MQVFILGAGLGTRLAPLTHILPKPLMPVFQKPLIQHMMDHFMRAGADEFIVNTSYLDMMWDKAFPCPEPEYRGCPVTFSHEDEPLDSGGGVKKIMPLWKEGPVIVHNGDILTDIPLEDLLAEHSRSGNLITMALRSVDGKRNVGFDAATGRITDMRHALGVDPGTHQFAGTYIMEPCVADMFPAEEKFSIFPIWKELIEQGKMGGMVFDWANWHEIGTPADYLNTLLELPSSQRIHRDASIAPGAFVGEDCVVGQDAVIPADCELDDCIVWPRTHVAPGKYARCIITPRITVQA